MFWCSSSFLKGSLIVKNLDITIPFSLIVVFQELLLLDHLLPHSFCQLKHDLNPIQSCYSICFIYKTIYKNFSFYCFWIRSMHKTSVTKQTSHDFKIFSINLFIIVHTKKTQQIAFLLWHLHIFLWTCNFSRFVWIISFSFVSVVSSTKFCLKIFIHNFIFHITFIEIDFIFTIN